MALLSTPFQFKGLTLKNRVVMPPMCQYSVEAQDGTPTDWHFVHYVSRAVGGTGLIIVEMTDVEPDGRISNFDLGLWSDEQIPAYKRIISEVHKYGAKIGIQIAHAGRKAEDAEVPVSASAVPFPGSRYKTPRALTTEEVKAMVVKFQEAARRAVEAGVDTIEIHGAHGYLIHQFHSPLTNLRDDEYGRDKALFGVEIIKAIKEVIPEDMPLIMRISAVEYVDGGYGLEYSTELSRRYKEAGVDIFHLSSGGEGPIGSGGRPGIHPGYQVPLARAIKQALDVPVIAVGNLDDPRLAEASIGNGDTDLVAVGRGMLRDPYWALHAIRELSADELDAPKQYARAF
ncbi:MULTISPECIES: NADH:flavin oxidoreductase/NADH oxidase [Brevibacillus]|jgi:NADPH2 dehydrogenase|uniref:NADPH dehydrogenase n=1 Tax=Brevibacillus parabrevis TaxID=54914 RepID=A0A4Y3PS96_BREPA|nr:MULTISPECIES: NADH:flavin oxidoreductase/NADH oxidase [Brevibacillus]KZE48369.1 NADPH dehydrogenase [Brevibacillus parabrevis]MBU8715719.1 NADH:flavin oxidoreductase/NADH oxidase [Brevibacillus parabrevis]MDH6352661.1 NADPH2 dehydrogenase [Brevibacillus sp. 1238]MDR5001700.1 NADH:flavin oxidoreductase/NADH oxidase [Brevibacillus parabrevis]MED2257980.1 NADH:flavin oxidoreductase/NADH oxidase [Brevibacillus parabrevis]